MGILSSGSGEKAGSIKAWPASSAPAGWLKANGAAVSRSLYAALFNVIGTTYGTGDGSTTFNLPDFRGEFLRGLDDGKGVDSGRSLGSAQAQDVQAHTHTTPTCVANGFGYSNPALANYYAASSQFYTGSTGGSETRPRNQAALMIIKY